jgi:hypothetical protein
MNSEDTKVGHLKRVALSFGMGSVPNSSNLSEALVAFEFILGIGPKGYSPFECKLLGRSVGDSVTVQLEPNQLGEFFEHLNVPLPFIPEGLKTLFIHVQIISTAPADPREVIKKIAEMTHCSTGCCSVHNDI